jgi:Ca-activated chloride channel family protein
MMTKTGTLALLFAAALLAPANLARTQQPPPPQDAPRQVVTVELVNLLATVLDRRQRFVKDLQKEDFRVYEDGQLQQVEFFSRESNLPLRVGLLLDTSNSIRERLQFEKDAAIDFLHATIRRHVDQAFLMTFDAEATVLQDYTDDLNTLQEVILKQRAGGNTALYRSIHHACSDRLQDPPLPKTENREVRRVLVVISDGEDSDPGGPSRGQAIEACQRAGVVIYTVSTSTDWLSFSGTTPKKYHKTERDQTLEQFADETGGRPFFPYRVDDLARSFQDIGDELRSQYSIAYTPKNRTRDGAFRKIKVEVNRKGMNVRTRRGYFATRADSSAARPTAPSN